MTFYDCIIYLTIQYNLCFFYSLMYLHQDVSSLCHTCEGSDWKAAQNHYVQFRKVVTLFCIPELESDQEKNTFHS